MRLCSRCGIRPRRGEQQSSCAECHRERANERYREKLRPERRRVCVVCVKEKHMDEFVKYAADCLDCRSKGKTCYTCREWQPLDQFSSTGRPPDGCAGQCKACKAARARALRSADPEGIRERDRDPRRKVKRNAYLREKRRTDVAWRTKILAGGKQRYEEKRNGLRLGELYARDEGICHLCCAVVQWHEAEPDHVIPVSLHGPCEPWNVRLSHRSCNRRKGARLVPSGAFVAAGKAKT